GRANQEIDDLTKALAHARPGGVRPIHEILFYLASAELRGGNASRFTEYRHKAIAAHPPANWLLASESGLAMRYASIGDLTAAEAALAEASTLFYRMMRCPANGDMSSARVQLAEAQAALLEARGKHADAEALYRGAVAVLANDPVYGRHTWLDSERWHLARTLIRQGRLLEAEGEARKALL